MENINKIHIEVDFKNSEMISRSFSIRNPKVIAGIIKKNPIFKDMENDEDFGNIIEKYKRYGKGK